jgi:hypothetical protein
MIDRFDLFYHIDHKERKGIHGMSYRLNTLNDQTYLECLPNEILIQSEQDALDLVAACGENGTYRLMIHAENLTEDFYNLKTGLAGNVLQKFVNYTLKVAMILPLERASQGRFGEMVLEANRSNRHFHVFQERVQAEKRLIQD